MALIEWENIVFSTFKKKNPQEVNNREMAYRLSKTDPFSVDFRKESLAKQFRYTLSA